MVMVGGAEHAVARRELPLGWAGRGLYAYGYAGRELILRSDTGRLLKVIAYQPFGSDDYVSDGSAYFLERGVLMRADGERVVRLASLRRLGLSAHSNLQPAGRMVELQDDHRLVVLRGDGSLFARMALPVGREGEGISSALARAPDGGGIAFAAANRPGGHTETIYLLRAGSRAVVALHREHVDFAPCAHWANVAWRGHWLLYSSTEGNLAVIDTTGIHHTIDLSGTTRRLATGDGGFSAQWGT